MLFPALSDPTDEVALRFGDRTLTYRQLRDAATAVANRLEGRERVAAWAVNEPEIAVAVVGALLAGVPITPINPKAVVYTSGTTGPPKGAVLPRRAIASNLDALAEAWEWTGDDVVAHGLPLFHVHGLILGTLGPIRRGGGVHHLGRFSAEGAAEALQGDATMLFAVPTMYHRLAAEAEGNHAICRAASRSPSATA